ncbi:MAG: bifunctional phosphopantothenoylcysteine decarboxylase/phosphopantothenate--cysteine ligase CoaBC [Pseudomonadota bacterium]
MKLSGKHILLGVSGGIAAYKACDLVRRLREAGADVRVVMTEGATRFVTPLSLQALSGEPVRVSLWDEEHEAAMGHIELARWADAILIAPASADVMARLAAGMADDLLTTLCLASEAPLFLAPAMNRVMWAHPATQANARTLVGRGVTLFGPVSGAQACGETGAGRMLEPDCIVQRLVESLTDTHFFDSSCASLGIATYCPPPPLDKGGESKETLNQSKIVIASEAKPSITLDESATDGSPRHYAPNAKLAQARDDGFLKHFSRSLPKTASEHKLTGKRIVITAGPTREAIDPVRYITNRSSGRMGYALAEAARDAGAEVVLVSGPTTLPTPESVIRIDVETALQMRKEVMAAMPCDIFIGTAAVADYRAADIAPDKIKKTADTLTLDLVRNPDILAEVAARDDRPFTVGFAAETDHLVEHARDKLLRKKLDLIAANHVGKGLAFDQPDNALTVIWSDGQVDFPQTDKRALARRLIELIADRLQSHA